EELVCPGDPVGQYSRQGLVQRKHRDGETGESGREYRVVAGEKSGSGCRRGLRAQRSRIERRSRECGEQNKSWSHKRWTLQGLRRRDESRPEIRFSRCRFTGRG